MYNNPYMNPYPTMGQQSFNERIDNQIAQLQQMKEQMKNNQQQPAINQTFQLAPSHQSGMKFANSLDDVNKEMVYVDTPFFSKDMSVVWIKNNKNDIKTYELNEIVPKDSKDLQIEYLQAQIEELKKGQVSNEQHFTDDGGRSYEPATTKDDATTRTTTKTNKLSSVSRVSKSKSR